MVAGNANDPFYGEGRLRVVEHDDVVDSAEFSPDGKRIITASWDDTARLWDATTGKLLHD